MKFQDPPSNPRDTSQYMTADVQAELRAHPGQWALLVDDGTLSTQAAIRAWCKRHSGFEMTTRSTGGRYTVYVRYIGNTDPTN